MKAVGQIAGGVSAYDAGKYSRRVMNVNGQNAQNAGVSQRDQIRRQARDVMGAQITAQGGSGFQMGTGSALDMLHQSAINRELDIAVSRAKAGQAAAGFKQQGALAYAQGYSALTGGILSGVETIASSIAGAAAGGAGAGADAGGDAAAGGGFQIGGGTSAYFASNPFGG